MGAVVKWTFLAIIFVFWSVAMWMLLRMLVAGWYAGQRGFSWPFSGSFIRASYNRKHRRVFALCIGVMIAAAVVYNLLWLAGLARR
jgi:hypothetical protein